MHELSIALSIIEMATEEAAQLGNARVETVHLRVGPLVGVAKEALLFSYQLACEGTRLSGSRLQIDDAPLTMFCRSCGCEKALASVQRLYCPDCREPAFELLGGRELD